MPDQVGGMEDQQAECRCIDVQGSPTVTLTHRHTFALKNNMLSGVTLPAWLSFLWRHGGRLDWWPYAPRIGFLTLLSAVNSLLAVPDWVLMRRRVAATHLHPDPVFILGHPRTGTTHLHNLLSRDARFACVDTLAAGFPSAFLTLGPALARLAAPLLDPTRPMDAMALSFQTPAEDEIAVCALTGGTSPYMPLVMMRDQALFQPYYQLESASAADTARWLDAFTWFLKKVTLRAGGHKPLLLKSPVHTARVPLLLKLFPRAKFIYIHRDPYTVFSSAAHMADSYYPYTALQRMTPPDVTRFILDQFSLLHDAYQAAKPLIPPGNLVEVSFAELEADAVGTLRSIYDRLGLAGFDRVEPDVQHYCSTLADFKKNDLERWESWVVGVPVAVCMAGQLGQTRFP
ncbi:hypothetical protein ACKKBF_B15270 [Auxenochlorella protothecoides x Auxenochlorella symbiontica]